MKRLGEPLLKNWVSWFAGGDARRISKDANQAHEFGRRQAEDANQSDEFDRRLPPQAPCTKPSLRWAGSAFAWIAVAVASTACNEEIPPQTAFSEAHADASGSTEPKVVCNGAVCTDNNPCTDESCDDQSGSCKSVVNSKPCDADGDLCSENDLCKAGKCVAGAKKSCDDGKACTQDICDPKSAKCLIAAGPMDTKPCDDGSLCTLNDQCQDGGCTPGKAKDCDDGNPCSDDTCDAANADCLHKATSGKCEDGNACTTGDSCQGGNCLAGFAKVCDDKNPCTTDSCDAVSGCLVQPNAKGCEDGNACTQGDLCKNGTCVAGSGKACDDDNPCTDDACDPGSGDCSYAANALGCEDGNLCTVNDVCKDKFCHPGSKNPCDDANPCTQDSCLAATGKCKQDAAAYDGKPCDSDGSVCTAGDGCKAGSCLAGTPLVCDDKNPCTDDLCNPATGCALAFNVTACDDGNACTHSDGCASGNCSTGKAVDCDDNNPCTADSCAPSSGCGHVANTAACDDGNPCTVNDTCAANTCSPGKAKVCDDKNPCTDDACNPASGCTETANANLCSDGDACTSGDQCKAGACTAGVSKDCDDGDPCTSNACDKKSGQCTKSLNADPCDDGNACTLGDACSQGVCIAGAAKSCSDKNPCTTDGCDTLSGGCLFDAKAMTGKPCDADGTVCTSGDQCKSGVCTAGAELGCDDKNLCTTDTCDPKLGCQLAQNTTPCDDGNACTNLDLCAGGACVGQASSCDDKNTCTTDGCDTGGGCKNVQNQAPCSDGDACTALDVCDKGACVPGGKKNCDDQNPCTDDSCNGASGCVHLANVATVCSDGNACTDGDFCQGGVCATEGLVVKCDDANGCTNDTCDKGLGCLHGNLEGTPCEDGVGCTANDKCSGGGCKAGTVTCTDGNVCTADSCDAVKGCVFGAPKVCDDGNVCTSDGCDGKLGCVFANNTGKCEDGNLCTNPDVCSGGKCTTGPLDKCVDADPCTLNVCEVKSGCSNPVAPDGTGCGTAMVCVKGKCLVSKCGDGAVDPATEECDDGNDKMCDGCEGCQRRGHAQLETSWRFRGPRIRVGRRGTIEFWVKWKQLSPLNLEVPLITQTVGDNPPLGKEADWRIMLEFGQGKPSIRLWLGVAGAFEVPAFAELKAGDDAWHHIAFTLTQSSITVFVNGKLAKSGAVGSKITGFDAGRGLYVPGGINYVGSSRSIDELRISSEIRYFADFVPSRTFTPDVATVGHWTFDEGTGNKAMSSASKWLDLSAKLVDGATEKMLTEASVWALDACFGLDPSGAACGDGVKGSFEPCDDNNTQGGDGCSADCQLENAPNCGDGLKNQQLEACDDGNKTEGDGCNNACQVEPPCGDGKCTGPVEWCGSCPKDCGGPCGPYCGDGNCNGTEVAQSCPQDCPLKGSCVLAEHCPDNDVCTQDVCKAGKCTHPAVDCDDENFCTDDKCEQGKGCVHVQSTKPCDDGQACTKGEACAAGLCTAGIPVDGCEGGCAKGKEQIFQKQTGGDVRVLALSSWVKDQVIAVGPWDYNSGEFGKVWASQGYPVFSMNSLTEQWATAVTSVESAEQVIVVGFRPGKAGNGLDGWLGVFNGNGQMAANYSFGGIGTDKLLAVAVLKAGVAIAGGTTNSIGAGGLDGWLVAIDLATGVIIWEKTYGGIGDDVVSHLAVTGDGVLFAGTTSTQFSGVDGWVGTTDSIGTLKWSQSFGVAGKDMVTGVGGDDRVTSLAMLHGSLAAIGWVAAWRPGCTLGSCSTNGQDGYARVLTVNATTGSFESSIKLDGYHCMKASCEQSSVAIASGWGADLLVVANSESGDAPSATRRRKSGGIVAKSKGFASAQFIGGATMASGGHPVVAQNFGFSPPDTGNGYILSRFTPWFHPSCQEAGLCAGLSAQNCDDGNPCTYDNCLPAYGCLSVTTKDWCDDNNTCTTDTCDNAHGCLHTATGDMSPCQSSVDLCSYSLCLSGICTSFAPVDCNDGNDCTLEVCMPLTGCNYQQSADNAKCEDGNPCTVGDSCAAGQCKAAFSAPDGTSCNDGAGKCGLGVCK